MQRKLLIFGSNGALGRGVTKILSQKNFDKIYLFDSKPEANDIYDEKITQIEIKDLSKEENVLVAFSYVKPETDCLYFLFSSIGGYWGGQTVWETNLEDWNRMFDLNLKTNFLLAKHFSWLIKGSAGGSICITTAYTAQNPETLKGAYGSSKNALEHLIKTLSGEGKSINMSANGISPYIIDTPANRSWMPDSDFSRWIKPEEIAEVAYSLFDNFNYVTGNIITMKDRFII
jgi:NAD(P)-dependent dehydrogenase (short-subunit alcohol dehydrogenase family)